MRETWVQSLGQEDLLEKEMATHSSILAWKIPWTDEPGQLQSMGSYSWTRLSIFTFFLFLSVLPLLSCVILGNLPDLSVLPIMSCVILGKLPGLSVVPHLNCVILGNLPDFSVFSLLSCVISGTLPWRRKQTQQALTWKQDSILDWTVDFELYAQYLWKQQTNWKTRPPEGRAPGRSIP